MEAKDYQLSSTYVATIDAGIEEAYEAFLQIDPMGSLATRLSALGVDDRAIWAESSEATGLTDTDGARELGFSLLWRFGPPGQTARIGWRVRLDEDGVGRTVLSIVIRGRASDGEAGKRIVAGWPLVETIALQHAKSLRRAVDEYTDDRFEAEAPRRRAVLSAAA
jgi:hypothetical protein